ncbi:hypothetical protein Cgig2_011767 [Carnegiea gigantea]|uniref:Uncharacterized protein n=1 Tax=Carnegiea gigantea TaxID=171969 RepID=A0A9Q1GSL7_9CARY|nr:hypothetical protein Cgig2_011767 [Carnegiea gigantea]
MPSLTRFQNTSEELWMRLTRPGRFPSSLTYRLTDANPPTGRKGYHLLVALSGGKKCLDQTEAVDTQPWDPPVTPRRGQLPNQQLLPCLMQHIPCEPPSSRSKNRLLSLKKRPLSGHTMTECRDLGKALHELADKGQINRFLKRRPRFLRREQEPAQPQLCDKECSMEVVATIARGYVEGITRSASKTQLRSAQSKNLEVDFVVVDVPMTYTVILGHPTIHKPADARLRSGGKPQNSCPPETLEPASRRPCVNSPWPGPPFLPPRPRQHQPRPS